MPPSCCLALLTPHSLFLVLSYLLSQKTNEYYVNLFRLPRTETLQHELECSLKLLKDDEQWVKGKLMIFPNFACFYAAELPGSFPGIVTVGEMAYKLLKGTDTSATQYIALVMPFTEVLQITRYFPSLLSAAFTNTCIISGYPTRTRSLLA